MSIQLHPRFLQRVLQLDAATCIASGALQVAATMQVAVLTALPHALLVETGVFLLVYAALVLFIAARPAPPRTLVALIAMGNLGWAAGCGALLSAAPIHLTTLGVAYVAMQAVTVTVLAALQWLGLRQGRMLSGR